MGDVEEPPKLGRSLTIFSAWSATSHPIVEQHRATDMILCAVFASDSHIYHLITFQFYLYLVVSFSRKSSTLRGLHRCLDAKFAQFPQKWSKFLKCIYSPSTSGLAAGIVKPDNMPVLLGRTGTCFDAGLRLTDRFETCKRSGGIHDDWYVLPVQVLPIRPADVDCIGGEGGGLQAGGGGHRGPQDGPVETAGTEADLVHSSESAGKGASCFLAAVLPRPHRMPMS